MVALTSDRNSRDTTEVDTRRRSLFVRDYRVLIVLGLVGLNALLVFPLFGGGYTHYMGSIETAYIADARYVVDNYPDVSWNHVWYMGFPFHLSYTPALPYALAALQSLFGIPVASAYRLLIGVSYACIPATLFLLACYVTGRRYPAFVAALLFSLGPSFCYLIPAVRNVGTGFTYAPWHLVVLLLYGEGPHISALAFVPLAALGLMRAMRRPSLHNIVFTALATSAVALINWIALFALTVILLVIIFSELLVSRRYKKLKIALVCVLLTYGLCAFWFNVSFLQASLSPSGGNIGQLLRSLLDHLPMVLAGLIGIAILGLFSAKKELQPVLLIGGWLLAFSIIVFGWYGMGIRLGPQPKRYGPELNMAACVAFGMIADWGRTRLSHIKVKWARLSSRAVALAVLVLIVLGSIPFMQVAHVVTRPAPDMTVTSEYEVAQWLASHVKDERVYATGSHAFWLNVFTDVPQIRGGTDQGATNSWWSHVSYQINTGQNGSIDALWARALDIKYIVVSYPGSADAYQDYLYPSKFEGLLPKVYDDRGMVIYEIPLKQPGLVRLIDLSAYNRLLPIMNTSDTDNLSLYVDEMERTSSVNYHFVNSDRLEFDADLEGPQQAVLMQMTYDPGWQAYCNGQTVPIRKDLADFILIEPQVKGLSHFVLQHGPLWDEWLGYALTILTILAIAVCGMARPRFKSEEEQPPEEEEELLEEEEELFPEEEENFPDSESSPS